MLSRCAAIVITALTFAAVHTAVAVAAAPNPDPIASGLRAGANFNVSGIAGSKTTPATLVKNPNIYAALGDSVAAGAGLPFASNATFADQSCGRSPLAYPYLVAAATGKTLIHAACSGAKTGDLFTSQGISGPMAPQLKKGFAQGIPGLITITAGANDVHWQSFLRKCLVSTCGTSFDTSVTDGYIALLELKLNYAMFDINVRSNGDPPKVILTGYFNPLSTACSSLEPRFTAAEIAWLNGRLTRINDVIQRVSSRYSFTTFAPVDFSGHDICSSDPWVQGPNAPAPFHPTALGQQVITQSILDNL